MGVMPFITSAMLLSWHKAFITVAMPCYRRNTLLQVKAFTTGGTPKAAMAELLEGRVPKLQGCKVPKLLVCNTCITGCNTQNTGVEYRHYWVRRPHYRMQFSDTNAVNNAYCHCCLKHFIWMVRNIKQECIQ